MARENSPGLTGLWTSFGDAWEPPAEGSRQNHTGKDKLSVSSQLALEDEEFGDIIPIYRAAAISNDQEDAIESESYEAATESPLADTWDTAMKEQ